MIQHSDYQVIIMKPFRNKNVKLSLMASALQKKILNKNILLAIIILFPVVVLSQLTGYYDKYDYRRKRHEINIGAGATSCLTDLGGTDMTIIEINQKKSTKYLKSLYDIDLAKTGCGGNGG